MASLGLYRLKTTVPPASSVSPLTVASSLGIRFGTVLIADWFLLTTRISLWQALVAPSLLASPL